MEDLLQISKRSNRRVYLITLSQASVVLVLTREGFADAASDKYAVANAKVMNWYVSKNSQPTDIYRPKYNHSYILNCLPKFQRKTKLKFDPEHTVFPFQYLNNNVKYNTRNLIQIKRIYLFIFTIKIF